MRMQARLTNKIRAHVRSFALPPRIARAYVQSKKILHRLACARGIERPESIKKERISDK